MSVTFWGYFSLSRLLNFMLTEEEKIIVKGCASGKSQYQKQLYLEYGPIVQGVCHRYALNSDEEKDLFHDIFVFILTHFNEFDHIDSLGGWIYRISVNKSIDYYRRKVRYPMVSLEDRESIRDITKPFFPEVLSFEKLMEFVNTLPHTSRIMFNMFVLDGYSQKQISDIMGVATSNVRVIVHRAKLALQKKIREYLNDEEFNI